MDYLECPSGALPLFYNFFRNLGSNFRVHPLGFSCLTPLAEHLPWCWRLLSGQRWFHGYSVIPPFKLSVPLRARFSGNSLRNQFATQNCVLVGGWYIACVVILSYHLHRRFWIMLKKKEKWPKTTAGPVWACRNFMDGLLLSTYFDAYQKAPDGLFSVSVWCFGAFLSLFSECWVKLSCPLFGV